jgi:hypothetical protein
MNSSQAERRARWLLFLLIALLYLRGLRGEYVWDDRTFFVENDLIPNLRPWDLSTILLQPTSYWGENLPVSEFLFVIEHYLFGSFTPAYHVVSLMLYLAIGLAAWRFVENLYRELATTPVGRANGERPRQGSILLVASLFLLHPAHVEAVAYITGQQHLLYVLFSLLSINLVWKVWKHETRHRARFLAVAIGCYYLAILSKYQAASTGLFIALLWLFLRRKGEGQLAKTVGYWCLVNVPVALWLHYSTVQYGGLARTELPLLAATARGIRILGAHLILALKPYPLNFGYPFDYSWSFDSDFAAGSLVLGALAVSIACFRRSIVTVGLLIFVVFLFPVLQIFVEVSNATVYDRYLFLPILGLCLILERGLAAAASRWKIARWAGTGMAMTSVVALAALTFSYIPNFRSNLASMEHAYRTFPGWKRAAFDYEGALIEAGALDQAESLAKTESTFSEPSWVRSYFRGWIELERRNLALALPLLEQASRLIHQGGYFPFTGVLLGRALLQTGQLDRAELYLKDVLASPINQPIDQFRAKKLLEELAARRAGG